ncbi:hypothetical protein ACHAWF_016335 [Thalassiosira exigua]
MASLPAASILLMLSAIAFASAGSVPFRTIDRGTHSGIDEALTEVYRTAEDFEGFWAKHTSRQWPPPEAPDVDFGSRMVVAVFRGTKPSSGYAVEITSVDKLGDNGGSLVVRAVTGDPAVTFALACSVPFRTIDRGTHSGIDEALTEVYRTAEDFEDFWTKHTSRQWPPPEAPDVDFGSRMVVAVFRGRKPSGGYDVEIASVDELSDNGGSLVVRAVTSDPPEGSMVTGALTQPHHIISLDASDRDVVFEESPRPPPALAFVRFIIGADEGADLDEIASKVEDVPDMRNVQVLSGIRLIFADYYSDGTSIDEARMSLSNIDGVKFFEEEEHFKDSPPSNSNNMVSPS